MMLVSEICISYSKLYEVYFGFIVKIIRVYLTDVSCLVGGFIPLLAGGWRDYRLSLSDNWRRSEGRIALNRVAVATRCMIRSSLYPTLHYP